MNGLFTVGLGLAATENAADITLGAANLTDLTVGDTTTGFGVPANGYYSLALTDIGTAPLDSITGLLTQFTHALSATARSSTDGLIWTNHGAVTSGTLFPITSSTDRYWLLSVQADSTGGSQSAFISDVRWAQASGGYVTPGAPNVPTPDFSITPASQSPTVQNNAGNIVLAPDLTVNALAGFAGNVALAITGQPVGLTATLSTANVAAGGSASLTLSAAGCVPGNYDLTITGTNGSLSHTQVIHVTVTPAAGPPVPAPTLAATPQVAGNHSSVLLSLT